MNESALISAASSAATVTDPPADSAPLLVPVFSTVVDVLTFTMFWAISSPALQPDDPVTMTQIIAVSLVDSALMTASFKPMTETLPPAVTVESTILASTSAGSSLPINGSPSNVSMVLSRKACDLQPIVLKASVTPTVFPADWVRLAVLASSWDRFWASTTTSPVVVFTTEWSMLASASDPTTFAAMVPPTAIESPPREPNEPPPEDVMEESETARRKTCSSARTVTLAASTSARAMAATAPPRTSFMTTRPPTA